MAPISGGWSASYLVGDKISHLLELYFPRIGRRPHSKKGIFRLIFKLISLSCQLWREVETVEGENLILIDYDEKGQVSLRGPKNIRFVHVQREE